MSNVNFGKADRNMTLVTCAQILAIKDPHQQKVAALIFVSGLMQVLRSEQTRVSIEAAFNEVFG